MIANAISATAPISGTDIHRLQELVHSSRYRLTDSAIVAQLRTDLERRSIHDRDPLFTKQFKATLKGGGVRALKMPKQSPNLNAYSERFVQTAKNECTDKMIFFGQKHLEHVLSEFVAHFHEERPHQGLDNRRIVEPTTEPHIKGRIFCRERIGGLLKSYYRKAA